MLIKIWITETSILVTCGVGVSLECYLITQLNYAFLISILADHPGLDIFG